MRKLFDLLTAGLSIAALGGLVVYLAALALC